MKAGLVYPKSGCMDYYCWSAQHVGCGNCCCMAKARISDDCCQQGKTATYGKVSLIGMVARLRVAEAGIAAAAVRTLIIGDSMNATRTAVIVANEGAAARPRIELEG